MQKQYIVRNDGIDRRDACPTIPGVDSILPSSWLIFSVLLKNVGNNIPDSVEIATLPMVTCNDLEN
jgi:hypothetical protein